MADATKTTYKARAQMAFADGDTRVIALDNPRNGLTEADFTALNTTAAAVLIGDKSGATFTGFTAAEYVQGTRIELDLSA